MEETKMRGETSLRWAVAFVLLGAFYVIEYFYQGRASLGPALTGLGFLALAPHSYFQPVRLRAPLSTQLKSASPVPRPASWLAVVGVLLLLAGIGVRWL